MRVLIRSLSVPAAQSVQETLAAAGIGAQARAGRSVEPIPVELEIWDDSLPLPEGPSSALARVRWCAGVAGRATPKGFDAAVSAQWPHRLLSWSLRSVIARASYREQAHAKRATLRACGMALGADTSPPPMRALFAGPPHPHVLALRAALEGAGIRLESAVTPAQALDRLYEVGAHAVVINAAHERFAEWLPLCSGVRRGGAALNNAPLLVLAAEGAREAAAEAERRGALQTYSEAADPESLATHVIASVLLEAARQRALHELEAQSAALQDARGLIPAHVFARHIDLLAREHHASGRPLCAAALPIAPERSKAAPALAGLLRPADAAALWRDNLIAVVMPFFDAQGAARSVKRLALALGADAGGEPGVFPQAVELQPGESGEALVNRALRQLEETTP